MHRKICLLLLLTAALARPALAWDALGHEVIARIAWEHMKPATREKAVALLRAAPPDADLADLAPTDRELFQRASTWPDIVRDETLPARREKYHHSHWHYKNNYWEVGEDGRPRDVDRLRPADENIVERLQTFERSVADPRRDAAQRAVDLAWILHLGGDIHQPLHSSSRVTATEPEGDRGGGLFKLPGDDLHWYWDSLLSKAFPRKWFEKKESRIERVARRLQELHPRSSFADRLEPGQYEKWAQAGFASSKSFVYRGVERDQTPSRQYDEAAFEIVKPAVALAGYRLAAILDRVLGGGAS